MSVIGCGHKAAPVQFCNAGDSGPVLGQVASITLSPSLATVGESLNYGQIGQYLSASAVDCKGNSVSVRSFVYASTSSFSNSATGGPIFADINPSNGQVCGGTWNRNVGGAVPDYTTCTPPPTTPSNYVAYVTATANGAVSNAIPVYVHPVVTGVVLGGATPTGGCPTTANPAGNDPGTDCFPVSTTGTPISAPVYNGSGCLSQGADGQLVARVYANGNTLPASNITAQVGHLTFTPLSSNIVAIDENGIATANQPGASVIYATLSNSSNGTNAGYFSTCPPSSIVLSVPSQPAGTSNITVSLNNLQPLNATVYDTNNKQITGLNLEFNSTSPQTIPASTGSVTPAFPGSATITAVCLPSSCNPAPFSQIGLYGNGKPITSNGITVTTTGTSSTELYMGSTSSQYIQPVDFSTGLLSPLLKLPYAPNSMVINQSGTTVYLGSPQGLMTINTAANSVGGLNQSVTGSVLSVSPDGSQVVITDPVRQTVSLVTSGGALETSYGGVGVAAQWTPDSQTVYIITTEGNLLTHSNFTAWQSVPDTSEVYTALAVTVPSVGAYFSGPNFLDGRSYCTNGTLTGTGTPPSVTNTFTPLADEKAVATDQLAATTDGKHILGAHANGAASTLTDLGITSLSIATACPQPGTAQVVAPGYFNTTLYAPKTLTSINATTITGVEAASNSAAAFVTYTGNSGLLPFYLPSASGAGTLSYLTLGNGATTASAPAAGVFSTDNLTFYVGTSGGAADTSSVDNDVHLFTLNYPTGGTPTATESSIISPNLPLYSGAAGSAPVNLLAQFPRRTKS